jgi:hypothetical protein
LVMTMVMSTVTILFVKLNIWISFCALLPAVVAVPQVSHVQRKFLHLAVDRFRHDSKVMKIAGHALFKTFAIFATAASASYFLILAVSLMIVSFWLCALVRHVSSGRFFPRLLDVTSFTMSSCTFLALIICFSLPIYIQQGDLGSPANLDPRYADDSCIFYNTLFNRTDAADASLGGKQDMYCDSSFWSVHLMSYFNGSYPSVLYRCPLRVSRAIVYAAAASISCTFGPRVRCSCFHSEQVHFAFGCLDQSYVGLLF